MKRTIDAIIKMAILTILITNAALADQLAFPAADIVAPVIEQKEFINKVEAGKDHRVLVTATDNIGIKRVILYYRFVGTDEYQTKTMHNVDGSDDYAATFSVDELKGDGIEYYVQASDHAGNTLLLGYAFSPLVVTIENQAADPRVAAVAEPVTSNGQAKNENSYKKWLWIGLGVLAVGAIASGGGDEGGGGGTSQESSVTVNAPVP